MAKSDILAKIATLVNGQGNQLGIGDIAGLLTDIVNLADAGAGLDTSIAPEYDKTATYSAKDLVIYEGALYSAKANIGTAEVWTPAHWDATSVAAVLATKADKV